LLQQMLLRRLQQLLPLRLLCRLLLLL